MSSEAGFCPRCGKPLPGGGAYCPSCGAPVSTAGQPSPRVQLSGFDTLMKDTEAQNYWLRRLIAFVVDAVIVNVALIILVVLFAVPFALTAGISAIGSAVAGVYSLASGIILFLYFIFADNLAGGTIGKRVFGLRVVGPDGRPPILSEAILRNISKIYWLLLLLDVVIGLAVSKKYTQKYSDSFARTDVVEGTRAF